MENEEEFDGVRGEMYETAIARYPNAREEDIDAMFRLLNPQQGERILGIGEGNGYFCREIASAVGREGFYLALDSSIEQIGRLRKRVSRLPQLRAEKNGHYVIEENSFDKVWSFGAFHHINNQTKQMQKIYNCLKKGGKSVICDVFQGSELAKYFDMWVAQYCVAGHEVKFLSSNFAYTIAHLAGFEGPNINFVDLPQKWKFDQKRDIGDFIYHLHALTKLEGDEEERIARAYYYVNRYLGVEKNDSGKYELNWPMKALIAVK